MEYEIVYSKIKNIYIQIKEEKIIVKSPPKVSKKEINKILKNKEDWIRKTLEKSNNKEEKEKLYTNEEFKNKVQNIVNELIKKTGLIPNKVRIRDIKYAWGTCSEKKNITISYKLINYTEPAIRYVILHELCHIKYMNHSKEFWNLVEKYMPNYKYIKKEFK